MLLCSVLTAVSNHSQAIIHVLHTILINEDANYHYVSPLNSLFIIVTQRFYSLYFLKCRFPSRDISNILLD